MTDEKKKILLVDDNKIQLIIAENVLKNDYTVFIATSGKEAIEHLLKGSTPDLILLDIIMPEMDGWETFHRIKAISLLKDIPIMFLTSETEESIEKKAFEIGAVDYIKKPFKREDLLNRIKNNIKA
jgi:putative two-component system response regulator